MTGRSEPVNGTMPFLKCAILPFHLEGIYTVHVSVELTQETDARASVFRTRFDTLLFSMRLKSPYHTIPYHTIPYHTIPYNVIRYHTILYTMLFNFTVLHYQVLYIVKCYTLHIIVYVVCIKFYTVCIIYHAYYICYI